MRRQLLLVLLAFLLTCFSIPSLSAQETARFRVTRAEQPPEIDGDLSDATWQDDPLVLSDWLSYDPLYGESMAQRTEVRVRYDDRNLYFAFHCFDDEPDKIRTTISRRDSIFNDDWVGLSLDSAGTGQTSYHMMVNPSGIQMDALNTSASGERWEADWVWNSAGKLTSDGYTVEVQLPLQSIRFRSGQDVEMGILFWRRISRRGVSAAWPDIPPGQWVFNRHATLQFSEIEQPRLIEILPSVTYGINQIRTTSNGWNDAAGKGDIGFSGKFGITSSITLDATVNPDFSQVESDAFQVQVNQRFPTFFSEKRPFFMEGMGLFNLAGSGGDGNMISGVHTRRIINPNVGTKLTGTAGRFTFGMLTASDETPQDIGNRGAAVSGADKLFNIGRVLFGLGESNYIGAIVADTRHAGRHNRTIGADMVLRFGRGQQLNTTFLSTDTGIDGQPGTNGYAGQLSYNYSSRSFGFLTQIEHYDQEFQMDTGFYNRTGITSGWAFVERNFYPADENSFLKRASVFYWNKFGRDRVQGGNEHYLLPGIRFNFTRQGFFRIDQGFGKETFAGQRFTTGTRRFQGGVQIMRWLNLNGQFNSGWATYYDPDSPFQGKTQSGRITVSFQPNSRINENVTYNRVRFDRADDGSRVYTVHILNFRSIYQFNRHFFLRGIAQYDSSRQRVLTDFLASYEFAPGTVLHAGYGALFEKQTVQESYLNTSRGLFLKASYLYRF